MGNYAEVMMKDRLPRKRINWLDVLYAVFVREDLREDFRAYQNFHKKMRSLNRICYNFLLKVKGRNFIKIVRNNPEEFSMDYVVRCAKTKWATVDDDFED